MKTCILKGEDKPTFGVQCKYRSLFLKHKVWKADQTFLNGFWKVMHHVYISNNINIQDNKSSLFFKMNIFLSSVKDLLKLRQAFSDAGGK